MITMDLCIFVWGRPGLNQGPLGLRQFLTVRPAKSVKKVAERSKALVKADLQIAITFSKMNIFSIWLDWNVRTKQLVNALFQKKYQISLQKLNISNFPIVFKLARQRLRLSIGVAQETFLRPALLWNSTLFLTFGHFFSGLLLWKPDKTDQMSKLRPAPGLAGLAARTTPVGVKLKSWANWTVSI